MNHSPVAVPFDWKTEVQHFVVNDVLYQIAGNRRGIEFAAEDDRPMTGIVMAQDPARIVVAPAEAGRRDLAVEEAVIQTVENLFQIMVAAVRRQ